MTPRRRGRTVLAFSAGAGAGALLTRRRRASGKKRLSIGRFAVKGIRRIKKSPRGYRALDRILRSKSGRRLILKMV